MQLAYDISSNMWIRILHYVALDERIIITNSITKPQGGQQPSRVCYGSNTKEYPPIVNYGFIFNICAPDNDEIMLRIYAHFVIDLLNALKTLSKF